MLLFNVRKEKHYHWEGNGSRFLYQAPTARLSSIKYFQWQIKLVFLLLFVTCNFHAYLGDFQHYQSKELAMHTSLTHSIVRARTHTREIQH